MVNMIVHVCNQCGKQISPNSTNAIRIEAQFGKISIWVDGKVKYPYLDSVLDFCDHICFDRFVLRAPLQKE